MAVDTRWRLGQQNEIKFVMVDTNGLEVTGLGSGFTLEVSKPGATAFVAGAGTKGEISNGWYRYLAAAAEADAIGSVAIRVSGAGTVQQNLEYVVEERNANGVEYTYTLTDSVTTDPIEGAFVEFSTASDMSNIVWSGVTDSFGVARDGNSRLPYLDPGTYYIRANRAGYVFGIDTEVVS